MRPRTPLLNQGDISALVWVFHRVKDAVKQLQGTPRERAGTQTMMRRAEIAAQKLPALRKYQSCRRVEQLLLSESWEERRLIEALTYLQHLLDGTTPNTRTAIQHFIASTERELNTINKQRKEDLLS